MAAYKLLQVRFLVISEMSTSWCQVMGGQAWGRMALLGHPGLAEGLLDRSGSGMVSGCDPGVSGAVRRRWRVDRSAGG